MKKFIISILVLAATVSAFGQPKEAKVVVSEAKVTTQGSYTPSFSVDGTDQKVKNVILLIGDGMGLAITDAAMYANGGELTMTNLRHFGFVRTQSANSFTTDSAASGTAYACGSKTNNGFLGKDPQKNNLKNIPEKVSGAGIACGVVSTDDLNGATPAAFFAHQASRNASVAIWGDIPTSCLTYASAGTMATFEGLSEETQKAIKAKFTVVGSMNDVKAKDKKVIYLPESVQLNERGDYLPATTAAAIEFLNKKGGKNGFFLMSEGARIDKSCHANNGDAAVKEVLDFDKTVEAAIRFAEKDGHTLVLISADHETGCVGLSDAKEGWVKVTYSSTGHTPIAVPIYAYGPHSQDFCCYQENSDICNKIVELLLGK